MNDFTRDCLHDRIGGSGGDIRVNFQPAAQQVTKLFFGALAAAGENQHLKIEKLAGRIVAG